MNLDGRHKQTLPTINFLFSESSCSKHFLNCSLCNFLSLRASEAIGRSLFTTCNLYRALINIKNSIIPHDVIHNRRGHTNQCSCNLIFSSPSSASYGYTWKLLISPRTLLRVLDWIPSPECFKFLIASCCFLLIWNV